MLQIFLAMLLAVAASTAHAQPWLNQPGVAGTTVVDMGTAQVRLPPGEWRQVAETTSSYRSQGVPLVQRVYVQVIGGHVGAVAYVSANREPATTQGNQGFRVDSECYRNDVFLNKSEDLYVGQWDCMLVNHNIFRWQTAPELWQQALNNIVGLGDLPQPTVYASFSKASPARNAYATLTVFVDPALSGFPSEGLANWAASGWHKDNLTPARKAYMDRVAAWAEAYRPVFRGSWSSWLG